MKEDSNKWLFCEWRDELNGHSEFDRQGFSSLYNIYTAAALEAYALMADDNAVMEFVQKLKKRIHEYFYQPDSGLYASRVIDGKVAGHYHEHTQALMLVYDVAPQEIRKELAEKVCNFTYGISGSLSSLYLSVKALEKCGIEGKRIFDKIITNYEPMLKNNTGTLWETAAGGFDFGYAGSLCHGWSALPVYIAKALMLGVKPLQAGWKQIAITPDCCGLDFASGAVPTPYGNIEVSFTSDGSKIKTLKVRCPKAITCSIIAPDAVIETEYYQ